jgi:hypothetical protein
MQVPPTIVERSDSVGVNTVGAAGIGTGSHSYQMLFQYFSEPALCQTEEYWIDQSALDYQRSSRSEEADYVQDCEPVLFVGYLRNVVE